MSASAASLVREQKVILRKTVRAEIAKLSNEEIEAQSQSIAQQVLALPEYQQARSISVFLSMPGKEVSTRSILHHAFSQSKAVYVPYIYTRDGPKAKDKVMDMLRLRSQADLDSLKSDAWGIPSLGKDSIQARENALGGMGLDSSSNSPQLDLIFMPAVAFDQSHHRLGHGRGFYDRYLQRYYSAALHTGHTMPLLVGLALRPQYLQDERTVPVDGDDWLVDSIVAPIPE